MKDKAIVVIGMMHQCPVSGKLQFYLILRSLNASFNVCVFGLKCPISIIMLPLAA